MKDIQVLIAGAAGEGIQTIGTLLANAVQIQGYAVISWQEFESRIRGGVNSFSVRISDKPTNAPRFMSNILLGLSKEAVEKYADLVAAGGIIFSQEKTDHERAINIPFGKIAKEEFGNFLYSNTVALGTLCAAMGIDKEALFKSIQKHFSGKSDKILDINIRAADRGFQLAQKECGGACPWSFPAKPDSYYLIGTHLAISLASIYAGCRFISCYPMSPSTSIITHLSGYEKKYPIFVETAEDEIAAINMAIGASYAGGRAMTATSGGGFALMNEGVSLAGMTETPLVIILAMRPGPATGLPTRTAQEDLLFAIFSGHGEFPKLVFAPADPLDAFHKTVKAFNLADEYQIPVIVMTDQFLADALFSFENFPIDSIEAQNHLADPKAFSTYKRYRLTQNGISPRLVPGQSMHLVGADSDEHDEEGHITEHLGKAALAMRKKRLNKIDGLRHRIEPPTAFMAKDAQTVFVSWGSSRNAVFEAVKKLNIDKKPSIGMIHFSEIWPPPLYDFPAEKKYITVESNATGQFQKWLQMEYGLAVSGHIQRFDGLPLSADYIQEHYTE